MANAEDPYLPGTTSPQVSSHTDTALGKVAGLSGGGLTPLGGAPPALFQAGGVSLDVGVDVTDQFAASLPAFGNVLGSIGKGVAASQTALDKGVIDMVNALSGTNIKVVTDVVQVLDENGLPDASQTQLITQDVSVLNYFTPIVHEWKNVSLAMDLTVGSFHAEQGLEFCQSQRSKSSSETGILWGFIGWFGESESSRSASGWSDSTQEVAWQSGQVRVDALLGPRTTSKLPVAATVSVGPQIYVTQGAVTEEKAGQTLTARTVELEIEVRKADGSVNPDKNIVLNAAGLLPSFTGPKGSTTDPDGKVMVKLKRHLFPGFTAASPFAISASLGSIRKTVTITL